MKKMRRVLKDSDFKEIITRKFVFNQPNTTICKECEFSEKTVKNVVRAFKLVQEGRFDDLIKAVEFDSVTVAQVEWAANQLNVKLPMKEINAAHERRLKRQRDAYVPVSELKEEIPFKPVVPVEKKSDENKNDALYMIKILEALNRQNELIEQLLDVVFPKYVVDLKDNMNVNADVICERVKNCEQSLEKIVCNSRKRGL